MVVISTAAHVATQDSAEGEAKRSHRPSRRRALSADSRGAGDRTSTVREQLDEAEHAETPPGAGRPVGLRRTGLCANHPGPWTFTCPDTGSVLCSEELIGENLNLARKYAWSWSKKSSFDYQELEALAYVGLIKGVRKFDPTKGFKLSTICVPYINGEILHFFRDKGYAVKYPSRWREIMPKARKQLEAGEDPTKIASELGMDIAELEEMLGSMCGTSELRDEVVGQAEAEIELDLLNPLIGLADRAWERMAWHDQAMIEHWWAANRRRAETPRLQMSSFRQLTKHILEGRPLPEIREQLNLQFGNLAQQPSKPSTVKAKKPRSRSKAQLDQVVAQLGLFHPTGSTQSLELMEAPLKAA